MSSFPGPGGGAVKATLNVGGEAASGRSHAPRVLVLEQRLACVSHHVAPRALNQVTVILLELNKCLADSLNWFENLGVTHD